MTPGEGQTGLVAQFIAVACYGLLRADTQGMLLRFVDGRPVSAVTTQFLAWLTARLAAEGNTALLMVWDNASWHISQAVRAWLKAHNRRVKRDGERARLAADHARDDRAGLAANVKRASPDR